MSTLHLEILTIERKVFDDQVSMVVVPGVEGVMGILPQHAPLVSALRFGELQIKRDGKEDEFYAVGGGFLEVKAGHAVVLANSADNADDIDEAAVLAARARAEEILAQSKDKSSDEFQQALANMQRSELRLKISRQRSRRGPGAPVEQPLH